MTRPDLAPAAWAVADLLHDVRDEHLAGPTPCPDYTVAGMITHIHGLAQVFTATARKDLGPLTGGQPQANPLPEDWRESTPEYLNALGLAWREPEAWTGTTEAGGVTLPGDVAGLVALNEVVVHGWDLARATGQDFDPGDEASAAVHAFLAESRADGAPSPIFGPVVAVPETAPLLHRAIGLSGRHPHWPDVPGQTTPAATAASR
ncbi:hypothetical protein ASE12_17265 [Aeromicrobium sp. Root236]|uniref:TIGR03086 family metal-binding protein n=1 Tax=Aeromicrobium sp. Root236 TaxID=1736498 RepID=UPI000700B6DD|nr:TIGR03086 family metal-binding protein [Aeromicrobium sp. Root236]KRC66353.1 hypothetical protein ASE12_17265 [Aeromicrobium sp. Root236]